MLSSDEFVELVATSIGKLLNDEQKSCVIAAPQAPLLIIAGPGTGKTTVMVLRALRHMLVDQIPPESIVVTTFTKKAAQEVRTRWLEWGLPIVEAAIKHPSLQSASDQEWLGNLDLNRCLTGTLDSICEELLGEYRPAGTVTPVLIEGYPANQRLLRSGLQSNYYAHKTDLDSYLSKYAFRNEAPRTQGDVINLVRPILDRFTHDQMDLAKFRAAQPDQIARERIADSFETYRAELSKSSQVDFALMEQEFLSRMQKGVIDEAVMSWKALLVDEYQDTNPIQEAIYFEILKRSGSSLSIVGDDDQSLYRFRGATVELFTQFVQRVFSATGQKAQTVYLNQNYRSTPEIVEFFNKFIVNDGAFASARIQPPKPAIAPVRLPSGIPILGMFRPSPDVLAKDLSKLLTDVFRKGGASIPLPDGSSVNLAGASPGGDFGDAVVLSHSVNEYARAFMGQPPKEKFPLLLRRQLAAVGIAVFNPRGQSLSDQPSVQVLLGLMLECLDRSSASDIDGTLTPAVQGLTNASRARLLTWRQQAAVFMASNPAPGGLTSFVDAWSVSKNQHGGAWPDDWPLLELCFKLITWMPAFHEDPEHQVWLEAISRAAAQARLFSPYGGTILNQSPHDERSRSSIIRDILRPIAEGLVDVDEELIPAVPRDRLSLMTIHQSKGLEFPLVIVDISSGYATNHAMNAAQRFPTAPSNVACLEDDLAPFSNVGQARTARTSLDRSFDDLVRLYYVAYSRPQTALLIVGHEKTIAAAKTVKNVASSWRRDSSWGWHDLSGIKSTFANQLPMVCL